MIWQKTEIRNSTAEVLTFMAEGKEDGIPVLYKDETVWATQKAIAQLFDVDRSVVTKHLKNIFETAELQQDSVCAKIAHTAELRTSRILFAPSTISMEVASKTPNSCHYSKGKTNSFSLLLLPTTNGMGGGVFTLHLYCIRHSVIPNWGNIPI